MATPELILDRNVIEAELVRRCFGDYLRRVWPIVEPSTQLVWNWHIDAIGEHLEAVKAGEILNLVIQVPPGFMKSTAVSVAFPSWMWLDDPGTRSIYTSHDKDLVHRDSVRTRRVVKSPIYQEWVEALARARGERPWQLTGDQNLKSYFENSATGFRLAKTIGAGIVGHRGHGIVVDDPIDVKQAIFGDPATVAARMRQITDWYDKVLSSRLLDKRTGWRVTIMQRVHEADLAGQLQERDGTVVLCLPMEFDPEHPYAYDKDPRTEEGELLDPERFPEEVVEKIKVEMGDQYAAQCRQRPESAKGKLFKREYVADRERITYDADPHDIAAECDEVIISVDCSFKGKPSSDPVGFHVIGRRGSTRYLLGRLHERMDFSATSAALRDFAAEWPEATVVLVEEKANGPAVISDLQDEVSGVIGFNPDKHGSKYARAQVTSREWQAFNWRFPSRQRAPWIGEYFRHMHAFPGALPDEDIDCDSQASIFFRYGADEEEEVTWGWAG
ncbi:MAG: hypothetical protein AAFX99_02020 [Myxococcota bacterium]